jgi:poly(3-hydroxybutyrate) depolymerase
MRPRILAAALLLALPGAALADVVLVGGRPVRGTWWEDGNDVVVNPYNSTNRAMTFGVERYPKSKVAVDKIRPTETPEEEYCRRAFGIRFGTAEDRVALAKWCAEKKLKDLAAREWERVLEAEPAHEEARKALGASAVKEILRRNGKANPALGELLKQYLDAENPATRRVLFQRMKREHDLSLPGSYLERAWRSGRRPKGRTDDVPLTLRSKVVKGKRGVLYTMFVPSEYDPLQPTPLLVGLHGGGRGGKDGTEVTGSGPSAMNFYMGVAEERRWLVACPTALAAPWSAKENEPFLEAMMDELFLLYNVDVNRVYLTGHSMGGYGSWHWGPAWAERWAAIAPMAGGGGGGAPGRLRDTQTPCYLFHGTDDNVCPVGDDRSTAEQMLKGGNDFVYTELNGVGHGCPPEVLQEMAAFFEVKRLAVGRGRSFRRSDEIRSSFLEKHPARLLREEKDYLGDPEPPDPGAKESASERRKHLLAQIDLGGGGAEEAARKLGETGDEEAVKPLAARLLAGKIGDDVRAACARALGLLGSEEALPSLERALGDEKDLVYSAAVEALVALGKRTSGPALLRALDLQGKRFDEKRMGNRMSYNDYEIRCRILGETVGAAGALAEPADAVARIRDRVVKGVIQANLHVDELARAGMFPKVVRAKLAAECARALGKTGHASAAAVLADLRVTCKGEGEVETACDEALREIESAKAPVPEGG